MIDFDLVPRDYRLRLAFRRWLRRLGTIAGATVFITAATGAGLAYANNNLNRQIQQLQTQHAMTTQQRTQLETLDSRIQELGRQWQLLNTLRSGAPAEQIFLTIDAALDNTAVWFQEWAFTRAGTTGDGRPATVNTGYFIVVPSGEDAEKAPAWQIETHIRIKGQAQDHAALSGFVRSLFERGEVRDVRVQHTALRRYATASVVDFELAILLDGEDSES
ncbi:MAG: hypothetical protein OEQ74_09740 [Gammaproteobacteria bacterium]|nr:hypothetical protein [Gammaproteobacteria bacterium]